LNISVTTNAAGEFQLTGLPPCNAQLSIEKAGFVTSNSKVLTVRAGAVESVGTITLPRAAIVEGVVTDAISGEPIYNAQISFNNVTVFTDRQGAYRTDRAEPGSNNMIATHNYQGDRHSTVRAEITL